MISKEERLLMTFSRFGNPNLIHSPTDDSENGLTDEEFSELILTRTIPTSSCHTTKEHTH